MKQAELLQRHRDRKRPASAVDLGRPRVTQRVQNSGKKTALSPREGVLQAFQQQAEGGSSSHHVAQLKERLQGRGAVVQRNGHPLANTQHVIETDLLNQLQKLDPEGTLEDLALGSTLEARTVLGSYARRYGSSQRARSRGRADLTMLRTILSTALLHRSGGMFAAMHGGRDLSELEDRLFKVLQGGYDEKVVKEMLDAYGLNKFERNAVRGYTDANKHKKTVAGEKNPRYMGKDVGLWNGYQTGWNALASAMRKLPNLGQLGLELTTYRTGRELEETEKLQSLEPESNIRHGGQEMGMGQKHYLSTAMTYNPAHWGRVADVGGMIGVTGRSGVFINPFGVMSGFLDGGEILYPPDITTRYEGVDPWGYQSSKQTAPVFHLREVKRAEEGQRLVEDKDYDEMQGKHPRLDQVKMTYIRSFEDLTRKYGSSSVYRARAATGIDGAMMYLTIEQLRDLYRFTLIVLMENFEERSSGVVHKARDETGIDDPVMYMTPRKLNELFRAAEKLL